MSNLAVYTPQKEQQKNFNSQKPPSKLRLYLKEAFSPKVLLWKSIVVFHLALLIILISFLVRESILSGNIVNNNTDLIRVNIVEPNKGVSFGFLNNQPAWSIYVLQGIPIFIGFVVIVFCKRIWALIPTCLITFGGLCNFVDRFLPDTFLKASPGIIANFEYKDAVVDYLQFKFAPKFAVFNFPDAVTIVGAVVAILVLISWTFLDRDKRKVSNEAQPSR